MEKARAGCSFTAQCEKALIALPIGGQTKLSSAPTKITANAVIIGTERFPAKKS